MIEHIVDEQIYHSGMIVGNHYVKLSNKETNIISGITEQMRKW